MRGKVVRFPDTGEPTAASFQATVESWKGPLPAPSDLQGYKEVDPEFPKQIVRWTQQTLDHQESQEVKLLDGEIDQGKRLDAYRERGQILAFILALVVIAAAFFLILFNHAIAGTILGSLDLVALATVFIIGQRSMDPEKPKDDA